MYSIVRGDIGWPHVYVFRHDGETCHKNSTVQNVWIRFKLAVFQTGRDVVVLCCRTTDFTPSAEKLWAHTIELVGEKHIVVEYPSEVRPLTRVEMLSLATGGADKLLAPSVELCQLHLSHLHRIEQGVAAMISRLLLPHVVGEKRACISVKNDSGVHEPVDTQIQLTAIAEAVDVFVANFELYYLQL